MNSNHHTHHPLPIKILSYLQSKWGDTRLREWQQEAEEQRRECNRLTEECRRLQESEKQLQQEVNALRAKLAQMPPPAACDLHNKPWLKLLDGIKAQIMRIRERVRNMQHEDIPASGHSLFLQHLDYALREAMLSSGAIEISNEKEYRLLRHELVPLQDNVAEGTPLGNDIEDGFGVCVGDRVIIRAQVTLSTPSE